MKKPRIKPYLYRLLIENIAYIVGSLTMLILIVVVVNMSLTRISKIKLERTALIQEINTRQNKVNLLNSVFPSPDQLNENIAFLNRLIPNSEDYFSIIYSLEKLSEKTGFTINGYTVNIQSSTANKLRLTISGSGDSTAFLDFLENYNFSGGRLITSDKIELNPQTSTNSIKIDLTFYNKTVDLNLGKELTINESTVEEINELKNKVQFTLKEATIGASILEYPKKDNPF